MKRHKPCYNQMYKGSNLKQRPANKWKRKNKNKRIIKRKTGEETFIIRYLRLKTLIKTLYKLKTLGLEKDSEKS